MITSEYFSKERDFLHGIATPLMVATGQIEYLIEQVKSGEVEEVEMRLQKASTALNKVSDQLNERRDFLKKNTPTE